ncbi:MAG TPA: hypothetical protein DCM40_33600 [Maribacter sp.]|nr:hypothetical protein [Maribacter sp.]
MTQIVGFAGKKQSGKNTACNYILALKLAELGVCKKSRLSSKGVVEVTDIFGETLDDKEWFEFSNENLNISKLFEDHLGNYIRIYGLADTLKDLCIDVLGLTYDQVYGTDKDKNSKTNIEWSSFDKSKKGYMTSREVLQYVGTDFFRKLDPNVWINSLLRKIKIDKPEVALICDVRFKNEIIELQKQGAYIVGLTRDPYSSGDEHPSEKEIEEGLSLCNSICDNAKVDVKLSIEMIHNTLSGLPNVIPKMEK